MKLKDSYDWVVLGDHPGALLSAGLVARLSLSVLVVPFLPRSPLRISSHGQFLDPESNFQLGLAKWERQAGLQADCLLRLGILPSEEERLRKPGMLPQIVQPGRKIRFAQNDADFAWELEREFGGERAPAVELARALARCEGDVLDYWRKLPDRLTLVDAKVKSAVDLTPRALNRFLDAQTRQSGLAKVLRAGGAQDEVAAHRVGLPARGADYTVLRNGDASASETGRDLETFIHGLLHGLYGQEFMTPQLPRLFEQMSLGRTGVGVLGGGTAYRELLVRLAKRAGAHFLDGAHCRRIFVDHGRFKGIQVTNQGNVVGGRGAVLGCGLAPAQSMITQSGTRWLRRLKTPRPPVGWKYTLGLTVRAEAIAPGVSSRMVWKEEDSPAMEIEIAEPHEYGSTERELRLVFLRTILPFGEETLQPAYLAKLSARMFRKTCELFPFFETHCTRAYPEFRKGSEDDYREAYPFTQLAEIPENLLIFGPKGLGSESGVEGLFIATGESFPEWGSMGPARAALEATAWIAHRSGIAGPFGGVSGPAVLPVLVGPAGASAPEAP